MCYIDADELQYCTISLQYKDVGEPREKKVKSLLDDDDDEEEKEGPNEEPEDVMFQYWL